MSPTCATSSPSFKYCIGAGWAGTRVSLLQPQANARSPRPSRRFCPAPSLRRPREDRRPGQRRASGTEGRDGWTETRRSFLAAARPGQGCPRHVRRRAPALRPSRRLRLRLGAAGPARLRHGRRPPPSPRSEQLCSTRSLLQGFVRTAESRAQPPSRAAV